MRCRITTAAAAAAGTAATRRDAEAAAGILAVKGRGAVLVAEQPGVAAPGVWGGAA
jgi:hypothetical protein